MRRHWRLELDEAMDADRGGREDAADSPLSFSIPTSLQEYMERYMGRSEAGGPTPPPPRPHPSAELFPPAAALSSASVPVRHWFDGGETRFRGPPSDADTATQHVSRGARGASPGSQRASPLGSDSSSTWRRGRADASAVAARSVSPMDTGCEDDEGESLRSVARPRGIDERPHTRSSSRSSSGGQSRNPRGVPGAGDRGSRVSGRVRRSGAVGGSRSSSPVPVPRGRNAEMGPDAPSAVDEREMGPSASRVGAAARGASTARHGDVVDERVVESGGNYVRGFAAGMRDSRQQQRPAGDRGRQQRGRRSLSDFLREIEEIVRARRAENDAATPAAARPQSNALRTPTSTVGVSAPPASALPTPDDSRVGPHGNDGYVVSRARDMPRAGEGGGSPAQHMARSSHGRARPRESSIYNPRMVRTTSAHPPPIDTWLAMHTDAGGRRIFSGAVSDDRPGVRRLVPPRTAMPPAASSLASAATAAVAAAGTIAAMEVPESTAHAHAAQAAAAAFLSTGTAREAEAAAVGQGANQRAARSRFQLSSAATAFSLGGGGGGGGRGSQSGSESGSLSPLGRDSSSAENTVRWGQQGAAHQWQQQQQQQQHAAQATGGNVHREFFSAVAAARAIASGRRPSGEDAAAAATATVTSPDSSADSSRSYGQGERAPAPGRRHVDRAYRELLLARASYMAASSVSPDEAPPRVGTAAATAAAAAAAEAAAAVATGGSTVASGSGIDGNSIQRDLSSILPAFRRWEAQRPRLQIQWQDPDAESETVRSESLPSDGILTLTEHPSMGPYPRGFRRNVPGGDDTGDESEVERAMFSCLTGVGVRRLLLSRVTGSVLTAGDHRSPAWLDEWLENGAPVFPPECSGPTGDDGRCPRVGDVWEILEILLGWWSERVCAVVVGFPTSSEAKARRVGDLAVTAARAVESVQALRKLGECIMPLSRVRQFCGVEGGPTPRDAVLLKLVLVIHEGIAWTTGGPFHRHYRQEVIPTALVLYSSLAQDTLEGVDLEVGHTLPEGMFNITGTVRPSWPRWGGNQPSSASPSTPDRLSWRSTSNNIRNSNSHSSSHGNSHSHEGGARDSVSVEGGSTRGVAGESRERDRMGRRVDVRGFVRGPWMVFRVLREDYLEFYRKQESALGQVCLQDDMLC